MHLYRGRQTRTRKQSAPQSSSKPRQHLGYCTISHTKPACTHACVPRHQNLHHPRRGRIHLEALPSTRPRLTPTNTRGIARRLVPAASFLAGSTLEPTIAPTPAPTRAPDSGRGPAPSPTPAPMPTPAPTIAGKVSNIEENSSSGAENRSGAGARATLSRASSFVCAATGLLMVFVAVGA